MVADQLERGGLHDLQNKLAPAMRRDLLDWDPIGADDATRARERIYWLAVALADRQLLDGDVDLRDVLARAGNQGRAAYRNFYGRLLEISGREPVWGNDDTAVARLQDAISALLEGATVARRADCPLDDDDVVTASIALFHIFTRRSGEPPFDLEAALNGQSQSALAPRSLVMSDTASSYEQVVARLEALRAYEPGVIRHASLHGISGVARPDGGPQPRQIDAMRETMLDLVRRGWKLRRLVTLYAEADLDREVETARALFRESRAADGGAGTTRVQATVGGVGGHAATVVVDGHFATIGLDDPDRGWVSTALLADDAAAVDFWVTHFDQVFDDRSHTYVIWDRRGERRDHIEQLRARLKGIQRVLLDQLPPVELTPAERRLADAFVADPNATNSQLAAALFISEQTVKSTLRTLFRKLDVEKRAGLLAALQQRGMA